jgi:hypothetical protein
MSLLPCSEYLNPSLYLYVSESSFLLLGPEKSSAFVSTLKRERGSGGGAFAEDHDILWDTRIVYHFSHS